MIEKEIKRIEAWAKSHTDSKQACMNEIKYLKSVIAAIEINGEIPKRRMVSNPGVRRNEMDVALLK